MDRGKCILAMGLFAVTAMVLAVSLSAGGADADNVVADTSWYSGNSTASEFSIGTEAELRGLAQLVNGSTAQDGTTIQGMTFEGKTIRLTSDIQLTGTWTPIGNGSRGDSNTSGQKDYEHVGAAFQGTFDGNNYTISGLTIASAEADNAIGLFGVVDRGIVRNVLVDKISITVAGNENAGAIAGLLCNSGRIENCVSGTAASGDNSKIQVKDAGGIVGRVLISGTVSDCDNFTTVTGTGKCGGIASAAYYTRVGKTMTIEDCSNYANITSTGGYTGGIVGLSAASVENCLNTGDVTGKGASIGGIVGEQKAYGSVKGCTNYGNVRNNGAAGTAGTGGIVGWARYYQMTKGLFELYDVIEVSGCVNYGDVISSGYSAGGIIGMLYQSGVVRNNINLAEKIQSVQDGTTVTEDSQQIAVGFAAGILTYQKLEQAPGDGRDTTWSGNVSTTPSSGIVGKNTTLFIYDNDSSASTDCTSTLPSGFVKQSQPVPTVPSEVTEVVSETEEATVVISQKAEVASMTAVTVNGSITLKDATVSAGTLKLSVTDVTDTEEEPVVAQADKTFDVTISGKLTVQEILITFKVDVPDGKVPKVYSIVDSKVVEENVVSYTSTSVTVSTNHNTPFSLVFEAPSPVLPDFIPVPDNRGDDFPGYVPTQKTESPSDDSSTAQVAVIIGAIVVVLTAIVALLYRSR